MNFISTSINLFKSIKYIFSFYPYVKKITGYKMNSFFDVGVEQHIDKNGILSKIDALINWRRIEKILSDVHSDLGRTGYDVVQLFKCLLLQN